MFTGLFQLSVSTGVLLDNGCSTRITRRPKSTNRRPPIQKCEACKVAFLDFSNAFSTLSRQGLLDAFAGTNPPYLLTKWIHNYIIGHRQFIRANNKVSSVLWGSSWHCSFTILFTFCITYLFPESLVSFLNMQMTSAIHIGFLTAFSP